jgi:hypothetical protein
LSDPTLGEATEDIYAALRQDNKDLDLKIDALKAAMAREGLKEATFEPARLAQNNRSGRKAMQSYFRKRGVQVVFSAG